MLQQPLCSIVMQNILIFYRCPVILVTCLYNILLEKQFFTKFTSLTSFFLRFNYLLSSCGSELSKACSFRCEKRYLIQAM